MRLFTKLIITTFFTFFLLSLSGLLSAQTTVNFTLQSLGDISGQATSTTISGLTFTINAPSSLTFQTWLQTNGYPATTLSYMAVGTVATGNSGPGSFYNTNNAQGVMLFLGSNQYGNGVGAHVHTSSQDYATGAADYRIAKSDASAFKINSMYIDASVYGATDQNSTLVPVTITGYRGGTSVASTNVAGIDFTTSGTTAYATGNNALSYTVGSGLTGAGTITFTGSNWQNIDEIRFTATYPVPLGIDDITFAAPISGVSAPTTQATNTSYSSTTTTQTGISWTNGNGSSRAVFVAAASSGSPSPSTNTTYTANTVFASGTQIASSGWYCVYNGTGTSVTVTALTAGTTYRTMVVEYNGTAGSEVYFTSTATGNPANVTMPTSTTWNGTSWSNGNPSSTIDAIVSDVSNTAPASFSCKNLTINSGAALNATGITATVNGNITNSGNGFSGTGTITIAAASSLSGNAITINGKLNLSSGTFTTGGILKIGPGGALIGTLSNISGSVTLQQSIIAQRGWRMFANPFTTTQTFASLSSTNNVTIQTTGSSNAAGIADDRVWSNSSNAWADAGTSTAANAAYGLFIRGIKTDISGGGTGLTYSAGPTAFTYSVTGTLNTADYTVPAPSNATNFTLVGNPFAAPVNSSELTNGTGVSYYVYQISVTGDGRTKAGAWSTVLSSSAITPIPVLGVIAWKPSSSYTIHTSGINTTNAATGGLFGIDTPIPHIELQVEQNGNQQDNMFVRLDPAATADGTDKIDLDKFYNDNVNVYSITNDKNRLAVDARNVLDKIPLGISAVAGDYNFKLADNNLPSGTTVYLNDKYLNTQTALNVGDTYPFTISSDASTKGEQRFELSFSSKTSATNSDPPRSLTANVLGNITSGNLIAVQIAGATTPVTIAVKDMNGKALGTMNVANGIQYVHVGNTAKGMLLLQISDGKNSIIKKVMKL